MVDTGTGTPQRIRRVSPATLAAALRHWMADPRERSRLSLLHSTLLEARAFDAKQIKQLCGMLTELETALLVLDGIEHLGPDQRPALEPMRQALMHGRSLDDLAHLQIAFAEPWAMGPFSADGRPIAVPRPSK